MESSRETADLEYTERQRKKRLGRQFGIFFLIMFILTFASRAIYTNRLARVQWINPVTAPLTHEFTAQGVMETGNAMAFYGQEELRIKQVFVAEGEYVTEGALLYTIDTGDLEEKLKELELQQVNTGENNYNRKKQEETLAVWEQLLAEEGKVYAKTDGIVTEILQMAGERMTEGAVFCFADAGSAFFTTDGVTATDVVAMDGIEGLKIDRIVIGVGQEFHAGTLLYTVNLADLKECIASLENERDTSRENQKTENELEKLEQKKELWTSLLEQNGEILADFSGRITEVLVQSGDRMAEGASVRYLPQEETMHFGALLTAEQKEWVQAGDEVEVTFDGTGRKSLEHVEWFEQEENGYRVIMEAEVKSSDETGCSMYFEKDTKPYDYVIPKEALHKDGEQTFVYVLTEKSGVLGTELVAEELAVKVLDQNDEKAAVADELLNHEYKIVISSTKELKKGDVVLQAE